MFGETAIDIKICTEISHIKAKGVGGQPQLLTVGDYNEDTSFMVDYPLIVLKPRSENPQEIWGKYQPDSPVPVIMKRRID